MGSARPSEARRSRLRASRRAVAASACRRMTAALPRRARCTVASPALPSPPLSCALPLVAHERAGRRTRPRPDPAA
eukprot:7380726-Prymnesium_polylepis.2